MLRKHLSTSCKSRRGSDGDAPAPLTTAEEDAIVPRKRRRPQRRATVGDLNASPSPSSSDEGPSRTRPPPRTFHSYDDSYDSYSDEPARFPARRELDAHARLAPPQNPVLRMPQLSPTRFARPSDSPPDGPARIGASLDLPLAPAYAATPEALDPLSFPSRGDDWHAVAPTAATAADPASKLDVPAYSLMSIGNAIEPVVLVSPPTHMPPSSNGATAWNPTSENGNNMDDLFSWLFNMNHPSGTSTPSDSDNALNDPQAASEPDAFESRKRAREDLNDERETKRMYQSRTASAPALPSLPSLLESWDEVGWRFPSRDVPDELARNGILYKDCNSSSVYRSRQSQLVI